MSTETQTQTDLMKKVSKKVYDEALNGRNLDVLNETHSPEVVWHGPGGREIRGLEALKEMISTYMTAFPDLRMTVENEVGEGTLLATEWRAVGTHDGPLEDIPPTGNTIDIRGHAIARFDRGKVVEVFEVFDELAMLQQIAATSPWKNPGVSFNIGSAMSLEVNRATGQRSIWTLANSDRRAQLSQVFEGANGGR